MKIFISADIEGVNGICDWAETDDKSSKYGEFRRQMTEEVKRACLGAHKAGATEIFVKDAHDSALNLIFQELPEYVTLHRGWEGGVASMMGGLDKTFDAVMFIGYHSPSRSDGNSLSHTMNVSRNHHVKINGELASEFLINALYASYLNVPIAFLSGDKELTKIVTATNGNIETVVTKEGRGGACISRHPSITNSEIEAKSELSLKRNLKGNIVNLPKEFEVELQYRNHIAAYKASFYPGCKLVSPDTIIYNSNNYYDVLVMFKFLL